ncbi:MAG: enoyl-CoA hydratase/isomerase family protein [Lachnospiraceae bacterium]|nr:enoyl-CoA hydratase/isomerase family protein [Lachnospiraceae bacterium]
MDFVKYKMENHIGVITISRPEALNALNTQVLIELDETIDMIDLKETWVVVITGAGEKAFVAGADIGAMSNMSKIEGRRFGKFGNDIFRKIEMLPMPTIAAVNGYALGGGNELAMSCDIRYCSENAVFGQPEVGLGITPGFGGTQRLVRLVGMGIAKELLYSGRNLKADQALQIGLVNGICKQEELMPTVMKLATKIASNAPIAVRNIKRAITNSVLADMDHAIMIEQKCFADCFETEDQVEGMAAFLEKRKVTEFKNR